MRLLLANEQDALPLDEKTLAEEIETLAGRAGYEGELSVVIVSDAEMRGLNRRFLDRDRTTDVLAFPLEEDEGEVVVSAERACAVAAELGVEPRSELLLYVVHGVLHLMGHDDQDPEDARRMHAAALKLLRAAGHRNRITPPKRGRNGGE